MRRDWYYVTLLWMLPIASVRLEFALRHSNDECFHPDGNVLVIGDSWAIPGVDFALHQHYEEGYDLWPHKVTKTLGTKVRGPCLAYNGYRAADWAVEIPRYKIQAKENDLVIIHLGGNDSIGCLSTIAGLVTRSSTKKFFSMFDWCERVDYNEEIVKIMTKQVDEFAQNIETIVDHMRKLGFKRFLISEPPFHKNVPLVGKCHWLGVLDDESSEKFTTRIRERFTELKKKYPGEIEIFAEMQYLGEMKADESAYIDPFHAGKSIHEELTQKAETDPRTRLDIVEFTYQ